MVRARCSSAPARRPNSSGTGTAFKATPAQHACHSPLAIRGRAFRPSEDGGRGLSASPSAQRSPIGNHQGRCTPSSPIRQVLDCQAVHIPGPPILRPDPAPIRVRAKTADGQVSAASRHQGGHDCGHSHRRSDSPASVTVGKLGAPQQPHRPCSAGAALQQPPRFLRPPVPYHQRLRGLLDGQHVPAPALGLPPRDPRNKVSRAASAAAAIPSHPSQQGLGADRKWAQKQPQAPNLPCVQGRSMDPFQGVEPRCSETGNKDDVRAPAAGQQGCRPRCASEVVTEGEAEYWEWLFKEKDQPDSPYGSDVLRALLSSISPRFTVKRPEGYVPVTPSDISSSRYVRSDVWTWSGPTTPAAAAAGANTIAAVNVAELPVAPSPRYPRPQEKDEGMQQLGQDFGAVPESCSPERRIQRKLSRRAAAAVASILGVGEAALGRYSPPVRMTRQSSRLPLPQLQLAQQQQPMQAHITPRDSKDIVAATAALLLQPCVPAAAVASEVPCGTVVQTAQVSKPQQQQQRVSKVHLLEGADDNDLPGSPSRKVSVVHGAPKAQVDPFLHQFNQQQANQSNSAYEAQVVPQAAQKDETLPEDIFLEVGLREVVIAGSAEQVKGLPRASSCVRSSGGGIGGGGSDQDCSRGDQWGVDQRFGKLEHDRSSSGWQQGQQRQRPGSAEYLPEAAASRSRFYIQQQQGHLEVCVVGSTDSSIDTAAVPEPFERLPAYQRQYTRQASQPSRQLSRQQSCELQQLRSGDSAQGVDVGPGPVDDPVKLQPSSVASATGAFCAKPEALSSACGQGVTGNGQALFRRLPSKAWEEESAQDSGVAKHPLPQLQQHQEQREQMVAPRDWAAESRAAPLLPPRACVPIAVRCGLRAEAGQGDGPCTGVITPYRGGLSAYHRGSPAAAVSYTSPSPSPVGRQNRFQTPEQVTPGPYRGLSGGVFRTPSPTGSGTPGSGSGEGACRPCVGYGSGSPGGFRGLAHCIRARSAGPERPSPVFLPRQVVQHQSNICGSPTQFATPSPSSSSRRTPPPVMPLTWEPPPAPAVPLVLLLSPELRQPRPHSARRSSGHSGSTTPSCPSSPHGNDGDAGCSSGDSCEFAKTAAIAALMASESRSSSNNSNAVVGGNARPGGMPKDSIAAAPKVAVGGSGAAASSRNPGGRKLWELRQVYGRTDAAAVSMPQSKGRRCTAPGELQTPHQIAAESDPAASRAERLKNYCSILDVPPQQVLQPLPSRNSASAASRTGLVPSPSANHGNKEVIASPYAARPPPAHHKAGASSPLALQSPSIQSRPLPLPSAVRSPSGKVETFASPSTARSPAGKREQRAVIVQPSPSAACMRSPLTRRKALGSPSAGAVLARRRWSLASESSAGGAAGSSAISEPGEASAFPPPAAHPAARRASVNAEGIHAAASGRRIPPPEKPSGDGKSRAAAAAAADIAAAGQEIRGRKPEGRRNSTCGVVVQEAAAPVVAATTATAAASRCRHATTAATKVTFAAATSDSVKSPFLTPRLAAALGPAPAARTSGVSSSSSGSDCGVGDSRCAPSSASTCAASATTAAACCASSVESWVTVTASATSATTGAAAVASSVTSNASSRLSSRQTTTSRMSGGVAGHGGRVRYDGIPRAAPSGGFAPAAGIVAPSLLQQHHQGPTNAASAVAPVLSGQPGLAASIPMDDGDDGVRRNLLVSFRRTNDGHAASSSCTDAMNHGHVRDGSCCPGSPATASSHVSANQPSSRPTPLSRPSVDLLTFAPGVFSPPASNAAAGQVHMLPPRPRRRQWEFLPGAESKPHGVPEAVREVEQAIPASAAGRRSSEELINAGADEVMSAPKSPPAPQSNRSSAATHIRASVVTPAAAAADTQGFASVGSASATPTGEHVSDALSCNSVARRDSTGGGSTGGASRPASATSVCSASSNGSGGNHRHHHHWSYQRNRERALLINGAIAAAAIAGPSEAVPPEPTAALAR